jgi:hypothetical protein|tara:strand:+ start:16439 stop:17113 length:675 start_codon:yes stop_codon:yes gene_type:complete
MTLAELKTLIQNFCESTETTFVNTLDDIIKNAEERIFEEVQFDFFKKNVTGNVTAGSRFLTCPSDFIMPFSLAVIDSNSDYHFLDKKHPSFMQEYAEDISDTTIRGLPLYYAQYDKQLSTGSDNGSTLIIAPVPDNSYSVELSYLYKPNSLVTDTTGTWLSNNARNGLLYASLVEAYTFLKGEQDLLALYEGRYNQEMSRLKNRAEARSRQDEYRYDALRKTVS